MKTQPNRYYARWVWLIFIMSALPVILLGLFSYGKSSGVVREQMNKETALSLQQTQMNVEHSLKVVDQAATHFLGSKIIQTALNEPLRPDQFQMYAQVKTELSSLQRLDTGIDDIQVWSKSGNWLINNEGLYRLDSWLASHAPEELPEPAAPSEWDAGAVKASSSPATGEDRAIWAEPSNESAASGTADDFCGIDVRLLKRLPLTAYRGSGAALIRIPACGLSRLISVNADHEAVLMYDREGRMLIKKGVALDDMERSLRQSVLKLPRQSGQYDTSMDRRSFTVTYRQSDYNGWTYVSVVPLDQLTRSSREIGWFTLYICAGLLLLSIMASLLWSRRLYRPIAQIYKEVLSQIGVAAPRKPLDEIQMIGEQVHTLFDAKKRLESRLEGQTGLLRTFVMVKLFLFGMKEGEIAERMESLGMRQNFSRFCVLALQLGALDNTRFTGKDIDLLLFAVNNMAEELIAEERRLQPIVLGRTQATVLTGNDVSDERLLSDAFAAARLMRQTAAEVLGLEVHIGISLSYRRLPDVPRAYEEAVEAAKRHAVFGEEGIGCFADLGENLTLHYAYPFALQSELFDAVKLADRERARPLLAEMLRQIEESSPNAHDMQYHAVRLLMNVLGLASGVARQAIPMPRQQALLDELFQLSLPESGEAWFMEQLIEPVIAGIEGQTEVRHRVLVKQMVEMVHAEFDTDLTIDTCADRLHYNASYLGTLFRKSMDVAFSVYLAQYRHHIALAWLKETDMPVKEIAERLRYNNSQNFIRSFRKTEGVSPGKFRESAREADEQTSREASIGG
ncbi:helix-turn-helix domain-containing protein [Paenibacillus doosanensis]|uniref:HTH-type transcriptional regulator YesS n=1 Tax=Paenibacillus konkukensis TaxID=2020716 RepID=A0ABY4RUI2_9BACL|nr:MULTISPECIES: helix-turn-helix domain-containing protein [Paenibacillus]MCS7460851.1 helix-turn-helix domain-containing protein [Paenibacillus doosanensis]UQZ86266.1 HTH-type transcriptional regulator YesS [Paenibacillus konkukensis]